MYRLDGGDLLDPSMCAGVALRWRRESHLEAIGDLLSVTEKSMRRNKWRRT